MGIKGKYFLIVSEQSGLALDVAGGGKSPGTKVLMWDKHGGDNQVWYEHASTGTIRSKLSDLCIDFDGSNRMVLGSYKPDDKKQQWQYNKSRKTIDNRADSNQVLDIVGGSKDQGTEVCAYDHHGHENQKWKIEPVGPPQYFFIKSTMNGKVMDIEGGKTQCGAKVIMWDQSGSDNQLWFEDRYGNIRSKLNDQLVLDGCDDCVHTSDFHLDNKKQFWCIDGNKIVNRHNSKQVLDVKGANSDSGAEVCCWDYSGAKNQHWQIELLK